MNPLHFAFSIKAQVRSTAVDVHALSLLHGDFMRVGLQPNASNRNSVDISLRLVTYRPRSGVRLVSTRVNLAEDLSDLSSQMNPYPPENLR